MSADSKADNPTEKGKGGAKDSKDVVDSRDAKDTEIYRRNNQQESAAIRRTKKWASFARSKTSFGFKHLDAEKVPLMASDTRGISICLERVVGWSIPTPVIRELQRNKNEYGTSIPLQINC